MSTQTETYACSECNGPRTPEASVKGSFCSETCWLRHKGRKALNQVRADHRFCSSCGRTVKEVDTPPTEFVEELKHSNGVETAQAVVGFQDRTPEADTGTKEYQGSHAASSVFREGTICSCGVTDLRESDETLQESEWKTVLANFVNTLWQLEREGAIPERLNKDIFIQTYHRERDLPLAVGKGLYR